MILSVSRRTDIPCYYSDWFYNRIKEGFVYVRNPMNDHQISRISLSPKVVDCIVFWTKNPEKMLARMDELAAYQYYFQFTLTGYGTDMEPNVPHKKNHMIQVFRQLSGKIGADRVVWRYDPIIFSDIYTPAYHLRAFRQLAEALQGYTQKCIISFVDIYARNRTRMDTLHLQEPGSTEFHFFLSEISRIAADHQMELATCAEKADLEAYGIKHNSCIDKDMIEKILDCRIQVDRDKSQRLECGCIESIDIGTYNTCLNGCIYCYANYSDENVRRNCVNYDPASPILFGEIRAEDRVSERNVKSVRIDQISMFELK